MSVKRLFAFTEPVPSSSSGFPFLTLMRIALNISGVLCLLVGSVWILQGIDVLPGSFMTGQTKWAIYGALTVAVGSVLLWTAKRRRRDP